MQSERKENNYNDNNMMILLRKTVKSSSNPMKTKMKVKQERKGRIDRISFWQMTLNQLYQPVAPRSAFHELEESTHKPS